MFLFLAISSVFIYILCVVLLYGLSKKEETSRAKVILHSILQYLCLSLLVLAFISGILYYQESGFGHPIGTHNYTGFITDLMTLTFLFVIVLVYNIRIIRSFCHPIYTKESIKGLHEFILYLRPFITDNEKFGRTVKYFSDITFPAVSIANPHSVVQNSDSDKIFTDDAEWKSAVSECMDKCVYTIIHIGNTEGCIWELEQCKNELLDKSIFVVSSEDAFKMFKSFIQHLDANIYPPTYEGGQQVYFLQSPGNIYFWKRESLHGKNDVKRIISSFVENRDNIANIILSRDEAVKSPFKSLFDDRCFPKDYGWFSWAGLSLISFPFMGRLKWQYWITLIPLAIILGVSLGPLGLFVMTIIITVFGKRMIWLSSKWSGIFAVNNQINLIAITMLVSTALSWGLGNAYLSKHPIDTFKTNNLINIPANSFPQIPSSELKISNKDICRNDIQKQIEQEAAGCPIQLSDYMTVTSIGYDDGTITVYISESGSSVCGWTEEHVQEVKKNIMNGLKTGYDIEKIISGDITFVYEYKYTMTNYVAVVTICPEDWSN